MKVVTIGTGYVGINTAAALAYVGHSVVGVDIDRKKVEMLRQGKAPISEAGLDELLSQKMDLRFTSDLSECVNDADVIFIAVGTPSLPNGHANLDYVMSAARDIAGSMMPGHDVTIVVKSTVPVGVNAMIERMIRAGIAERGGNTDYLHFSSNPEFLREGCALMDTFYPDRFVFGTKDDKAYDMLYRLFAPFIDQTFEPPSFVDMPNPRPKTQCIHTDQISAEMIKYASNVFLALKISYANEIAGLCEKLGGNMADISRGMGMDKRIAPYFLQAGLGWGGSCFPKDSLALLSMARDYDYDMPIVQAAWDVNERQKDRLIQKLLAHLHVLAGRRIAVFGMTFKPNTDDVRNSPAVDIAKELVRRQANVVFHDPKGLDAGRIIYKDEGFLFCDTPAEAASGADAVVIATDWACYRDLDWNEIHRVMQTPCLLDARNMLRNMPDIISHFDYIGM